MEEIDDSWVYRRINPMDNVSRDQKPPPTQKKRNTCYGMDYKSLRKTPHKHSLFIEAEDHRNPN